MTPCPHKCVLENWSRHNHRLQHFAGRLNLCVCSVQPSGFDSKIPGCSATSTHPSPAPSTPLQFGRPPPQPALPEAFEFYGSAPASGVQSQTLQMIYHQSSTADVATAPSANSFAATQHSTQHQQAARELCQHPLWGGGVQPSGVQQSALIGAPPPCSHPCSDCSDSGQLTVESQPAASGHPPAGQPGPCDQPLMLPQVRKSQISRVCDVLDSSRVRGCCLTMCTCILQGSTLGLPFLAISPRLNHLTSPILCATLSRWQIVPWTGSTAAAAAAAAAAGGPLPMQSGAWWNTDFGAWPPAGIWDPDHGAATLSWLICSLAMDAFGEPGAFRLPVPRYAGLLSCYPAL